jgi:hypothetical protein
VLLNVLVTRKNRPVGATARVIWSFEPPAWMQSRQQYAILEILLTEYVFFNCQGSIFFPTPSPVMMVTVSSARAATTWGYSCKATHRAPSRRAQHSLRSQVPPDAYQSAINQKNQSSVRAGLLTERGFLTAGPYSFSKLGMSNG